MSHLNKYQLELTIVMVHIEDAFINQRRPETSKSEFTTLFTYCLADAGLRLSAVFMTNDATILFS